MVVTDPLSRLTFVTVVSVLPVVDVVEVVDETGPELSGNTIVVFDGGAAWVWATTGSGDSKIRLRSVAASFILRQPFGPPLVREHGWAIANLVNRR